MKPLLCFCLKTITSSFRIKHWRVYMILERGKGPALKRAINNPKRPSQRSLSKRVATPPPGDTPMLNIENVDVTHNAFMILSIFIR